MRYQDPLRAAGLALMLLAGGSSFAPAARAQAVLMDSIPVDRAILTTLPPAIELRFNTRLDKRYTHLLLTRADGSTQTLNDNAASAWLLRCTLAQDLIAGPYLLRYQVRDEAGRVAGGVLHFTLRGPR